MIDRFPVAPAMRRARIATTAVFFINGMALALFFSNIALLKELIALSDARLGTALGLQGLGTVIFVVIGSLVATKFGTRATMLFGAVLLALALQAVGFASQYTGFLLAILALGASNSFIDVSMNAHASLVEREYRTEIMPSFHAAYNFGGFAGASLAAQLIRATGGAYSSLTLAGIAMVAVIVVGWIILGNLKPTIAEKSEDRRHTAAVVLRSPAVLILGIFVAMALFVENAMNGWSGVYLKDVVMADPATAATAFAAFQFALAIGRLLGSPAIRRFGAERVVIGGGLIAAAGVLLAVTVVSQPTALIGFAAIGLGLANCTPMFFTRAAAAFPSSPALGIALVNTIGYLGYIGGPLALGLVSESWGLKSAFLLVLGAMMVIAFGCRLVTALKSSAEIAAG
ncbi:Nitrate/nitrite transporter NarK [Paracoccus pantotrophus]|nr:Nitrate/nitrite transporter NarK [Paracoccus pantotrophus]